MSQVSSSAEQNGKTPQLPFYFMLLMQSLAASPRRTFSPSTGQEVREELVSRFPNMNSSTAQCFTKRRSSFIRTFIIFQGKTNLPSTFFYLLCSCHILSLAVHSSLAALFQSESFFLWQLDFLHTTGALTGLNQLL